MNFPSPVDYFLSNSFVGAIGTFLTVPFVPLVPGSDTRAAVQEHFPWLQSRSVLHIFEWRMSVQSVVPLHEQLPWPTVPD
jgi:hypothetical protein